MSKKIAVVGASGYAGGEILRLLSEHPAVVSGELSIGALMGSSSAGERVGELLPHIPVLADRIIEPTDVAVLGQHDIIFLGLPHGHSARIAAQLPESTVIIDCAADFRLRDSHDWEHYYDGPHAGSWPYGLPELAGQRIELSKATRVAVPGCFPTGATLALLPAVEAGLIDTTALINIVSITGVSGGGKKANVGLLGAETMGSLKAYNIAGKHRHVPEIKQNLSAACQTVIDHLSFTPVLAPLSRGILSTATATLAEGIDADQVRNCYETRYKDEPFVQVLASGQQPETKSVAGSNLCQVQVEVDPTTHTLVATSAIDNLVKGTAGGAIQSMNLVLGLPETLGLPRCGLRP